MLEFIKYVGINNHHEKTAEYLCECGEKTVKTATRVTTGKTKSCGCLVKRTAGKRFYLDGRSDESENKSYHSMLNRCYNPNNQSYSYYGARGIMVCENWRGVNGYKNFINDIGKKPTPNHSIDRIDNNGNYSPENCKWSTRKEQSNNTRRNRLITYKDKTMTISQWSDEIGIDRKIITHGLTENGQSKEH